MARFLTKSWQDKRPGWTRRVRWYESRTDATYEEVGFVSIRLNFIDPNGEVNMFYADDPSAVADWEAFKHGDLDILELMRRKG